MILPTAAIVSNLFAFALQLIPFVAVYLYGLVLAELELSSGATDPEPPPGAVADVTEDDRFSGGNLALLNPAEARELLEEVARMTGTTANP